MKKLLMAAIAATMFVACNRKGETNDSDRVEVKFSSHETTTTTTAQTRVIGNEWESGDPIGIFMLAHGTTNVAENARNIDYQAGSNGANSAFSSTTPIYYPQSGAKVDFIAYHPRQALTDWKYAVNVASQTNQSAIDLMWTNVVNNTGTGYDKTFENAVNLHFYHKLVKLNLTVLKGAGTTDLSGLQVAINGMNTAAEFDLSTGTLSNAGTPAVIEPLETQTPSATVDGKYEAILLPVTAFDASHTITFTIGADVYTLKLTNLPNSVTSFDAGSKYDYNVTLNKHGVQITGTIEPWTIGDNNGVVAD